MRHQDGKEKMSLGEKAGMALALGLYLIPWGILTGLVLDQKSQKGTKCK